MLSFQRIYFDSNPLIGAGWPSISAKLKVVFNLAEQFSVVSYLPEREIVEHTMTVVIEGAITPKDGKYDSLKLNSLQRKGSFDLIVNPWLTGISEMLSKRTP